MFMAPDTDQKTVPVTAPGVRPEEAQTMVQVSVTVPEPVLALV